MLQNLQMHNGLQNLSNLKGSLINTYAKTACQMGYLQELYGACDHGYLMNMSSMTEVDLQNLYIKCAAQAS